MSKDKERGESSERGESTITPQIIAACIANIGSFALGQALTWSSPALPSLANCGDACDLDDDLGSEVASWIGSLVAVGCLMGAIFGGLLMNKMGLKATMIIMAIPFILGWLMLFLTKPLNMATPMVFYVGRVLTGVGGGSFALLCPTYTAETSEPRIRGAMGTLTQLLLTMGGLFNNVLGALISWTTLTAISIAFPVMVASLMLFMPESPYFLVARGEDKKAEAALQWLRGPKYDITLEMSEIRQSVLRKQEQGEISFSSLFTTNHYLKPLIIVLSMMFFKQYSGINGVLFYLQDLFKSAGTNIDPGISASLIMFGQVFGTIIAFVLVDKFGRRILLILSAVLMAISLTALAAFFYIDANKECINEPRDMSKTWLLRLTNKKHFEGDAIDAIPCVPGGYDAELIEHLSLVPLVSLMIYILSFSIGFGPLPWVMNGEYFSAEAKSKAATLGTVANWGGAFFVSKFQVTLDSLLTTAGVYLMYAAFCILAVFVLVIFVPESKGKTPEQMRKLFQR